MAHFGIICLPATGHLNTILPLGQELQQRGHHLTLFGIPDSEAKTRAARLSFQAIGESVFPLGWTNQGYAELGKRTGKEANLYGHQQRLQLTEMLLSEAPAALKTAQVEGLIVDYGKSGGGTVAEYLQLPFVTICTALISTNYGHPNFEEPILELLNQFRQLWHLPIYTSTKQCLSPLVQISHQPPEFDLPRTTRTRLPSQFHFTGPFHTTANRQAVEFPWSKLTGQPLIYASLGTLQNRLQWVFAMIAEACVDLDVQLVISLGGGMSPQDLPELPGSPLVVGYAPQLELLDQATLTITHAGLNTTLESLSRGVPLIAIPITHDQPAIASRIARKGLGIAITLPELSVSKLRTAIEKVLGEDKYRQKVSQLQSAIKNSGGVKLAADLVEEALSMQKPVLQLKN